jgi:hypothetical protein
MLSACLRLRCTAKSCVIEVPAPRDQFIEAAPVFRGVEAALTGAAAQDDVVETAQGREAGACGPSRRRNRSRDIVQLATLRSLFPL